MKKNSRQVALDALTAWQTGGVWSARKLSDAIDAAQLDRRDAALTVFLCGGVIQNVYLLDHHIGVHSKIKPSKLETKVLSILRLGVFQLLFAESIPANAAVYETVELCTGKNKRSKAYVNAVLRAVSRAAAAYELKDENPINYLSVKYSHPVWICSELVEEYGYDFAEKVLKENNSTPAVTVQVNTVRSDAEAVIKSLEDAGVSYSRHHILKNAFNITQTGAVDMLQGHRDGLFWVQDASSMLAVQALNPKRGSMVYDACAAPGGKTFAAYTVAEGELDSVAADITETKLARIRSGAQRLGFSPEVVLADAASFDGSMEGKFDYIICDVPCSGLGIIRKKPDIRYKSKSDIDTLPLLQASILSNVSKYLKAGGTLLYSTCTWRKPENDGVVENFLSKNQNFTRLGFDLPQPIGAVPGGSCTLWPHIYGIDGFFICLLRKNNV